MIYGRYSGLGIWIICKNTVLLLSLCGYIQEHGAAYDAGGLEVGQLILEVDGNKVEGMHHQVYSWDKKIAKPL